MFSAGNPAARAVLVGEQPGDVEDQRGIPFVGPAGKVLQRALGEAAVARADVRVPSGSPSWGRDAPPGPDRPWLGS